MTNENVRSYRKSEHVFLKRVSCDKSLFFKLMRYLDWKNVDNIEVHKIKMDFLRLRVVV